MRKALFLLLLASCGDNTVTKLPLEDFLSGRQAAECTRLARCGLFSSASVCNAYFRTPFRANVVSAVEKHKLGYDGAAAIECLEALAAAGCDKTQRDARDIPACEKVFTGRVSDGAACAFDQECKSQLCNEPLCLRDRCCFGTCTPTVESAVGGPCEIDAQCVEGAYCGKQKICNALARENMTCDDLDGCDFGLACVGVTDLDNGTCRRLPLIGEECPYRLCAEMGAACSPTFTCVAIGLPGAPCMLDRDCSSFAECDETTGKCIETPHVGESCVVFCAGESWCSGLSCVEPLRNGEMCTADDQCTSLYCAEGIVFDECTEPAVCI